MRTGLGRALILALLVCLSRPSRAVELPPQAFQCRLTFVACPQRILDAAQSAVVGRVGHEFYAKYVTLNGFRRLESSWLLQYKVRMASRPWIDEKVSLTVDSSGAVLGGVNGVPDCARHPAACDFSVTERSAVEAARRAGFDPGLRPWKVDFQWVAVIPVPTYAWVIINATRLGPDGCSGEGEGLIVDAGTAEVLTGDNLVWECDFFIGKPPDRLPADGEDVHYDEAPVPVIKVNPVYPDHARGSGLVGDVVLHVLVGKDGRVMQTKVVRGTTELNYAAIDAVRKWVFKPALKNLEPVTAWAEITVHFPPE